MDGDRELQARVEQAYSKKQRVKIVRACVKSFATGEDYEMHLKLISEAIDKYTDKDHTDERTIRAAARTKLVDKTILVERIVETTLTCSQWKPIQQIALNVGRLVYPLHDVKAFLVGLQILAYGTLGNFYQVTNSNNSLKIRCKYQLDPVTTRKLNGLAHLPPMVCRPNKVVSHKECGYLTQREHVILKPIKQHEEPMPFDALNHANSMPWSIDGEIAQLKEVPSKQFNSVAESDEHKRVSDRTEAEKAFIIRSGNKFWWLNRYCTRGRTYTQGYLVNIQGTPYKKALINYADEYVVEVPEEFKL